MINRPATIVISDWLANCQVGQWTPFEAAMALKAALTKEGYSIVDAAQLKYFTGCLRDGVCRGVCKTTDCPNYDLVVAARLVVENRVEGIVYPPTSYATSSDLDIEPIKGKDDGKALRDIL